MFSSCNPKFFAERHIHYPVYPSSDNFHTVAVVPSSDQYCTETVPPSSDHCGTTKVAPHNNVNNIAKKTFTTSWGQRGAWPGAPSPSGYATGRSLCERCLSVVPVDTNCCIVFGFILRLGLRYSRNPSHLPMLATLLY